MKNLKHTSLVLLSTLIMTTQSSVSDVLTEVQLHATLGVVTNFILDDNSISHNGTSYGEVTSPYTGRVWLDRNLGASQVCTSFDDPLCYGDYYQWGRNADGHEKSDSDTTTTLATDINNVGHGNFILTNNILPKDWASVDSLSIVRTVNWSITDGSSVCPVGFRVPNDTEISAELLDGGSAQISNSADAFNSFLKLPVTGYRLHAWNVGIQQAGVFGNMWSLLSTEGNLIRLHFTSESAYLVGAGVNFHASGYSVRCIKD